MKLHLIWDLDGTLVNSGPEILTTIQKSLEKISLSLKDSRAPLRIGPPLETMLRTSFCEDVLSDDGINMVIREFRKIYDSSDFKETVPFDGIDEMIHSTDYVHHIITNKPAYATRRIIVMKGWEGRFVEVLTPDMFSIEWRRELTKPELFKTFRSMYPDIKIVGIGDMAKDAECAKSIGIPAIGVLWGTGTKDELQNADCDGIVANTVELREILRKYC